MNMKEFADSLSTSQIEHCLNKDNTKNDLEKVDEPDMVKNIKNAMKSK